MSTALSFQPDVDVIVAGGGAVGLAIAAALADAGREVIVLEANERCGDETSGRNNQVIHAGFLYPPGSLKARLCREGHRRMLEYARLRGVPHRILPKLMPVLDEGALPQLTAMQKRGVAVGAPALEILDAAALRWAEPELRAAAALLSPDSGVIDAAAMVAALEGEVQAAGGTVVTRSRVTRGRAETGGTVLTILDAEGEESQIGCRCFVNAAGLGAAAVADAMEGFPGAARPDIHLARGQFLSHRGPTPFGHMVVPLEPLLSAGGSLTLDMGGQSRFGPDLSFLPVRDYRPDAEVSPDAVAAIRAWWPGLDPERLAVDFVGIRPRVTGPGQPPGDWVVAGPDHHGLAGQFHLFGIDTPGLTACLALADHVLALSGLARRH